NLMGDSRYMRYEPSCQLLVNGLDTYASVFLNGEPLGNFSNPHRTYCLNLFAKDKVSGKVKSFLKSGVNELLIVLKPPLSEVAKQALREPYPLPGGVWLHSRTASYQFGWAAGASVVLSAVAIFFVVLVVVRVREVVMGRIA
ncbi:MAG: glycosyl hydrolase 2 galactose-binding domain-containing protein, partial [Bacteroidota bacterium]